ncbi:DUF2231 domain-containing protein [Phycisphaerales bacterium AB-hyl4]|uniref:DUF2231 domain-containing protein n=1 Tax=Natronomicrosphaera hydrolytica TaxID=3242702 RepID=A0ABV4UA47_9BACT
MARSQQFDWSGGHWRWLGVAALASCLPGCEADGSDWLNWLGRLHVQTVHFPIALLAAAALAEWLAWLTDRSQLASAGRYCLWLGAVGALVAGLLGWLNAGWQWQYDEAVAGLSAHRWLGTAVVGWFVVLAMLSELARRRNSGRWLWAYRFSLLVGVALVGTTAHMGGVIVYGSEYFAPPW